MKILVENGFHVIKIDQTNIGATIAVKDNKKGLKLLDLKTLNISGNGITITAWNGATKLTTIDATGAYKLTTSKQFHC